MGLFCIQECQTLSIWNSVSWKKLDESTHANSSFHVPFTQLSKWHLSLWCEWLSKPLHLESIKLFGAGLGELSGVAMGRTCEPNSENYFHNNPWKSHTIMLFFDESCKLDWTRKCMCVISNWTFHYYSVYYILTWFLCYFYVFSRNKDHFL